MIPSVLEGFSAQRARATDNRRNLYVVGLPVDLAQYFGGILLSVLR